MKTKTHVKTTENWERERNANKPNSTLKSWWHFFMWIKTSRRFDYFLNKKKTSSNHDVGSPVSVSISNSMLLYLLCTSFSSTSKLTYNVMIFH